MGKIIFQPETSSGAIQYPRPVPASKMIPDWYKNTDLLTSGDKKIGISKIYSSASNLSIKGCVPFQDALISGYIFSLPCDVEVSLGKDGFFYIKWLVVGFDPAGSHSEEQAGGIPRSSEHNPFPFKWQTRWTIKTPKGYSTLFTHPLNRYDLPFRSFTGVVDTDKHPVATNFPFQLLDQGEYPYIIPAGTPIAQAIPFKRERWTSSYQEADEEMYQINRNKVKSKIGRSYRTFFWDKKVYR